MWKSAVQKKRALNGQRLQLAHHFSIAFPFDYFTVNCLFHWHLWVSQGYFLCISLTAVYKNQEITMRPTPSLTRDLDEKQTLSIDFRPSLQSSTMCSQSYFKISVIENHQRLSALFLCDFDRSQSLYKNETLFRKSCKVISLF